MARTSEVLRWAARYHVSLNWAEHQYSPWGGMYSTLPGYIHVEYVHVGKIICAYY
jgi:hypothetical protein